MANVTSDLSQEYLNETNVPTLITVCAVFLVLNTFFTVLRFISRNYQTSAWGWEDLLIGLGWLCTVGLCIDGLISPRFGVGIRFEKLISTHPELIPDWGANGFYAIPIIYCMAVVLPKMSVLVLYLKIFTDRISRACCWIIFFVLAASAIVNIITFGLQCNTPAASWDLELPGGSCNNIEAHLIYSSLPNIITDVAMLLLPLPVVRRLQLSTQVKIGLALTFSLASIGTITAIVRFAEFFAYPYAEDPTFNATPLIIWVVVESSIYLISACLLTFRPLLAKFVQSHRVSSLYSWLRRTGSRTRRTNRSDGWHTDHHGPISVDGAASLPRGSRKQNSDEESAERADSYSLEPMPTGDIRVDTTFGHSSMH